ncbi:hypothetical protein KR222_005069, partial [Zaprionus bogoriensis]
MILNRIKAFSTPNEALPFNTAVAATIRTENNDPVYSKLYPYPMGVADFVNEEIKQLLQNGIIRRSRSPYNSPMWVVDKKGLDANGDKKKRLVIDFRKLNERTIADRYPMPSIPMILANLENFVADALSRQNVNALQDEFQSDVATIHSEASLTHTIETTEKPLNCFRNQIILEEAQFPLKRNLILFGSKTRHILHFTSKNDLIETLKLVVNPEVVNGIHCDLPTLASFQHSLVSQFPATKFWHC